MSELCEAQADLLQASQEAVDLMDQKLALEFEELGPLEDLLTAALDLLINAIGLGLEGPEFDQLEQMEEDLRQQVELLRENIDIDAEQREVYLDVVSEALEALVECNHDETTQNMED